MPKKGYQSITVSNDVVDKIDEITKRNGLPSRPLVVEHAVQLLASEERRTDYTVTIGDKTIGGKNPAYIIAEIGINHNGDIKLAKKLIDAAVESGCDAVKFQKRAIDVVYSREELARPRESPFGDTNGDLKKGLEFGKDEFDKIYSSVFNNSIASLTSSA